MSASQRTSDYVVDLFVAKPAPPATPPKGTKIWPVTYNDMRAWPEFPVKQEAEYQARRRSSAGKPQAPPDLAALAAHVKAIEDMLAEFEAHYAAEHAKAEREQSSTTNPPAPKPNGADVKVECTEEKTFIRIL